MKRHIPHGTKSLTLCGLDTLRTVSDPEIGADPFDLCKTCRRIHRLEVSEQEARAAFIKSGESLMKRVDEILSKPCCNGACGAL